MSGFCGFLIVNNHSGVEIDRSVEVEFLSILGV